MNPVYAPYVELLRKYGRVLDLASKGVLEDPSRQLADVEAYAEVIPEGAEVLDVGSGGGLPGLPLALLRPDLRLTLCEIRSKRAAFLEIAALRMGLTWVRVYNGDVRSWNERTAFVTAQAVGSFEELYRMVSPIARYPLTMISRRGESELAHLNEAGGQVFHVKHLTAGGYLVAVRIEGAA